MMVFLSLMVYIERDIEPKLWEWLEAPEILVLRGPRQSGKTTLLRKVQEKLLAQGIETEKIHLITFEDELARIRFQENPLQFFQFYLTPESKHYFLLDEVQYIKEVGKKLKLLFDSFPNAKIIVTGSSSFDLTSLGSALVGRVIFFDLYSFSFAEFLRSKEKKYEELHKKIKIDLGKPSIPIEKNIFLDELNRLLHEYLTYGSYPRVVLEPDQNKKKELLKNMFTTYIEKDIVALYGIRHREKVIKLLQVIAATIGQVTDYNTLGQHANLSYPEMREILPLLQDSFVISIVKPFFKNHLNELRKNPKLYFIDYGLRNYLLENFEQIIFDSLYENFVHNELQQSYSVKYWRTTAKTEVDFILQKGAEIIPVEVKTTAKITRSFRSFLTIYPVPRAFVCTLLDLEKAVIDSCEVITLPFVYL